MVYKYLRLFSVILLCSFGLRGYAQTNTVEFGKNRLQFKKFDWRYYKTDNFDTYFAQGGLALGKYVAQVAEQELLGIEKELNFGLRERVDIVAYTSYDELKQSNIGVGLDWQNTGGVTKLVGNKMIVYFNGDHNRLKVQIREGIAKVILQNLLFGTSLGEFAGNATMLNLPEWYVDGYVAFIAEHWNEKKDNELKQLLKTGRYGKFSQLAEEFPTLAGQAFWYYVANEYGEDAPSYLLYISRIERNMKRAFQQVLHEKYKPVLQNFMNFNYRRYQDDNRGRRQATRGTVVTTQVDIKSDHYRIHPSPRNKNYAMVEFKHGVYEVQLYQGQFKPKILMKSGVRELKAEVNPDYPLLAWDPQGNQIAMIYQKRGKIKLKAYDLITRTWIDQTLPNDLQMIQSFQYLPTRKNTLLLSATKNGQSDLFTYSISSFELTQLTDDIFDDRDPSYVGVANKSGIVFTSNRPSPDAISADTVLPHHRFNVFLLSNWDRQTHDERQLSQLTNLTMGNASMPMQYNADRFTFVGDQNGIANRYVGSLTPQQEGLDTLYYIGADVLHNPEKAQLDSVLLDYGSETTDSVKVRAITSDSTYIFPLTNYADGISESYSAGQKQIVSETTKRGNVVRSHKLMEDTRTLSRRNVITPLTSFRKYQLHQDSLKMGLPMQFDEDEPDKRVSSDDYFQSEFGYTPPDSTNIIKQNLQLQQQTDLMNKTVLQRSRLFPYKLKFSTDYLITQIDNSVLIDRYQEFTGGGGPIYLQQPFNGMIQVGVSDLFEDIKFTGGFRVPSSFDGSEYFFSYTNDKHYIDYKLLYYRKVDRVGFSNVPWEGKQKENLFQVQLKYPIDVVRSVRLTLGYRTDGMTIAASDDQSLEKNPLESPRKSVVSRLEYVYDNTINPAMNIWKGLRWKTYIEMFPQMNKVPGEKERRFTFNAGVDARYYLPIYKNFIWATRVAGDFSFGNQKVLYYLGGVDNWLAPKYDHSTPIDFNQDYAFQTLSENLRGYNQNIKNGNNTLLLNTELRLPVFATFIDQPINSGLIRNFQITSFFDIGTAWTGGIGDINDKGSQPSYADDPNSPNVIIRPKLNSIGPFVSGYGFGARTSIGGYFLRVDAAWPSTNGFFYGKPKWYFALGVDF